MEPEPPFLPGVGADPILSEPELAPGPRTAGATQKSGGPATLQLAYSLTVQLNSPRPPDASKLSDKNDF